MADNKENKELQEQINSLREQELSLTKELVTLRSTLASISEKDAKNLEKIKSLKEKILDLENKADNVSRQIVDTQGQILTTQQEIVDSREEERDVSDDLLDNDKTRLLLTDKQKKIYDQIDDVYDSTVDLAGKLLQTQGLSEKSVQRIKAINESSTAEQSAFNVLLEQNVGSRNEILKVMRSSATAGSEMLKLEDQINAAQDAAAQGRFEIIDTQHAENALKDIRNKIDKEGNSLTEDAKAILEEKAKMLESSIDLAKEQNSISKEAAKTYENQKEILSSTFDKLGSLVSKVPGGSFLMKHLGFDKMKDQIQKNMGGALKSVTDGFTSGGLVGGMQALPGAAMQFGKALLAGPQVAIFALVAAVGALVSLFMDLDGAVSETQKELGGTKKEAMAAHEAAHGMAHEMNLVGVNSKEVVKGMSTVSELMGGIKMNANTINAPGMKDMVKDATLLTEKYGLSKDELANVHSLSIMSGKSMSTLAGEAIQVAGGVMKSKDAVKLLGGISKDVAVAFKGGTKELIAAAAKAKLLGMDLKKVKDIGMGMLDIEQSLEKEMEARAILGRDINLDAARAAALNGDVATLQDELLKQAGSLAEFQEGGPLKQKALADAMGMSVEEMTEMLTKAEEMNKLGLDKQLQEDLAKATAEEKANIFKKQGDILKAQGNEEAARLAYEKAAQEESASAAEKFGDIMTKIKETAMKLVAPILDVVHGLMDGVLQGGGLMATFDGIISVLKPIMEIVMGIGKVLFAVLIHPAKMLFSILTPIFDVFKEIFATFSSGQEGASGISETFDKIAGVISDVSSAIGEVVSIFISGLLTPAKILWKSILTPIWDTFKGIYDTLAKAFEPLFKVNDTGKQTVGIMDTIKKVISSLSPVLEVIGALIAGVIMKPFEMLANLIQIVIKLFTGDMTGAVDKLGEYLFDYFLGLPELIITSVSKIIDGIFGTNLTAGVTDFFGFIKDGFKSIAGLIEPIFGFIKKIGGLVLDNIMAPFKLIGGVIEGIGTMFTGDLMGGLKQIGSAITEFFMTPVNFVKGLFEGYVELFSGIGDKIKNVLKDLVPGWALDLLGIESGEAAPAAATSSGGGDKTQTTQIAAAANGGEVSKGGMMLVGEKGPEIVSLPQGASVASTSAGEQTGGILNAMGIAGGGSQTSGGGGTDMSKVEQKLDALISLFTQAANQPTVIKFGDKTVEEIKTQLNFKKAYNIATDNTYGRAVD